ncbi:MAG: hypothetical protein ACRC35_01840 [Angustibacter sp.]
MYGLTVRWSLVDADPDVSDRLREYVTGTSLARFSGREGLRFKTWRMSERVWFEGTYVWADAASRDAFAAEFAATAADSSGSRIVGGPPVSVEPFEVVAIAEGAAGFVAGAGPGC